MKLAVLILKDEDKLDVFIKECSLKGINNITVLLSDSCECDKTGNKRKQNSNILSSIRYMLDYYNDESRTILIPVDNNKLDDLKHILLSLVESSRYTLMTINLEEVIGLEK